MVKIIAGNWKMNGSKSDLETWFKDFFNCVNNYKGNAHIPDILISVPSIYLPIAQDIAKNYNKNNFKVNIGAEDCHYENKGAFTGNISPIMLKEFSINYSIVGHSERRQFEKEDNEIVNKKAKACIDNNIIPVVCVGEDLETRESGKYLNFIEKQVLESTADLDLNKIIIAYEPVWAIGTGKVPTMNEIGEINSYIKNILNKKTNIKESDIIVLYGGSVKSSNVAEITKLDSVDGVLVGGASLKGEEFFNIVVNSIN